MSFILDKRRCCVSHQSHSLTFERGHISSHKLKRPVTLVIVPELTRVSTGGEDLRGTGLVWGRLQPYSLGGRWAGWTGPRLCHPLTVEQGPWASKFNSCSANDLRKK